MASLKKNVASQNITFCLLSTTTGLGVAGLTVSTFVVKDGGSQASGSGTVTNSGNGQYNYAPTQAETNATNVGFFFTATGAVPWNENVWTDIVDANGLPNVDVAYINAVATTSVTTVKAVQGLTTADTIATYTGNTVQTGDAYARLGAPAGASVSADLAANTTATTAVKTQTDKLSFTISGQVDANIQYVNDTVVNGNGSSGTPWGP